MRLPAGPQADPAPIGRRIAACLTAVTVWASPASAQTLDVELNALEQVDAAAG